MKKPELFFNTLTPEILGPREYIDWENIKSKIKPLRREIALVQSLDKEKPVADLADLLNKEPKILKVLQLLIAHTPSQIYFDSLDKYIDFVEDAKLVQIDKKRAENIAKIFVEMGLIEFLKEIKNVKDIIKGVLIGLEPNVRKNRRGKKLEDKLNLIINSAINKINKKRALSLKVNPQMYIDLDKERKQIDYVITKNDIPKLAIEVNFYSTSGSKPSEVLGRAYPDVQSNLKKKNLKLIVITDGIGWNKMKPVIKTAFNKLDYLINLKQAEEGLLEKIILEIL